MTEVDVAECRYDGGFASSARLMLIHDTNNAQNITSTTLTNAPTAGLLSAKVCINHTPILGTVSEKNGLVALCFVISDT